MELLYKYSVWRDEKIKGNRKAAKVGDRYVAAVTQSTLNTHNSALNRVFDEALLRGWITNSIRPTLLNKGKKSESRGAFTDEEYKVLYTKLRTCPDLVVLNSCLQLCRRSVIFQMIITTR